MGRSYAVAVPSTTARLLGRGVSRVPGLRRLPVVKLLAIGEVALLAREHVSLLEPAERRRLLALVRKGRGRTRNLAREEAEELAALVAKAEPRRFAGLVADRLSPVALPERVVHGPSAPRRGR